MVAKIKG
jgi:hypothetical protein